MAVTQVALGIKGYMQYVREAAGAYGGGAAVPNRRLALLGGKIDPQPQLAENDYLLAGVDAAAWAQMSVTDDPNSIVKTAEWCSGELEMYLDYENCLQFFDMIHGTATFGTYGATYTGGTPNLHQFIESGPWFNAIQAELIENSAVSTSAHITGLQVTKIVVTGKAAPGEAGLLRCKVSFVGKVKTLAGSITGALVHPARYPVSMKQMSAFADGSGDSTPRLREFEFTIEPSFANTERLYGGSLYPDQQIRKGKVVTTLKFTREYTTDSLLTKYAAGTEMSGVHLKFTDSTRVFEITIDRAYIPQGGTEQPTPTADGLLLQTATVKALWHTSGPYACLVEFDNSRSTTTA